jgi:hypothetical protein
MKIYANYEYKIMISDYYNRDITEIDAQIDKQQTHRNVLSPCSVSQKGKCLYLHYLVSERGSSLRTFINEVNHPKRGIRASFVRPNNISPIDVILQVIDALLFMSKNRMLDGNTNINPDFIWVDYDVDGKIVVSVIDTMETIIEEKYRVVNENKQYWSAECLKEHILSCGEETKSVMRKTSLSRMDTVPSSFSLVYSLGLVLYFISQNHDPYEDGVRIYPDERPNLIGHLNNRKVAGLVWVATEPDTRNRPTLADFRKLVVDASFLQRQNTSFCSIC